MSAAVRINAMWLESSSVPGIMTHSYVTTLVLTSTLESPEASVDHVICQDFDDNMKQCDIRGLDLSPPHKSFFCVLMQL